MDTPGQISSHASSSLPSQSNHKLENETDDNVSSRMREMIAMEDDSHGSHVLSTVLTEIQEEFLKIFSAILVVLPITCVLNHIL